MEERILVWKNEVEYNKVDIQYQVVRKTMQEIADGLKSLGVSPNFGHIKSLLHDEDLSNVVAEKSTSEYFEKLPKVMQKAIKDMFHKESKDEYAKAVGDKAAKLRFLMHRIDSMVDMSFFTMEDGEIILSPDYIKRIEQLYCVYVDTPGKRKVYEKWLELLDAVKEFDEAVKNAPKREPTQNEQVACIRGEYLKSILYPDNFSLGKVRDNGEFVLNGEYFDWIE